MLKPRLSHFYARNKYRDKDNNSVFKSVHKNLSFLSNTLTSIFLGPTLVIGSLLTHTSMMMIANIFLSLGFMFNFFHRIYLDEVGFFEFMMTAMTIAVLIGLAFYLAPTIPALSFIGVLLIMNLFSSGINSFFLIRNMLIPPLAGLTRFFLNQLGFNIAIRYFEIHPLDSLRDQYVMNRLAKKYYGHDIISQPLTEQERMIFDNQIQVVSGYINKYQESFFGYINRYDHIKKLDDALKKLTEEGDDESTTAFIHKKIAFKSFKILKLKKAKELIDHPETPSTKYGNVSMFFPHVSRKSLEDRQVKAQCHALLDEEIKRQEKKINRLQQCDPVKLKI